ncbi:hypothetical protein NQ314_011161 [Rhamnusium bicolor]|uniref:Uncharacterized protein n=1 Tax=Rhamnusium bicolor TaxID=1586634 RepID=A0AAV8XMQ0_9CUCU|nr:hypothetical protein NQ314_011161 [Rhamnusium bicolor]
MDIKQEIDDEDEQCDYSLDINKLDNLRSLNMITACEQTIENDDIIIKDEMIEIKFENENTEEVLKRQSTKL